MAKKKSDDSAANEEKKDTEASEEQPKAEPEETLTLAQFLIRLQKPAFATAAFAKHAAAQNLGDMSFDQWAEAERNFLNRVIS